MTCTIFIEELKGVGFFVDFALETGGDLGVDRRCGKRAVTEENLDRF